MAINRLRHFIYIGFCLLFCSSVLSQQKEIPKPFNPPRLVNDYVGILSQDEFRALESKLVEYNDSTSIQIAVVIEKTTGGEEIFTYAQRLAETWGIGQEDTDNGILILVTTEDRGLRIHPGYGAEGFLPDGMSKRIIDRVMVPSFREGQFYKGLDRATEMIMQLGTGEYEALVNGPVRFPIELLFVLIFLIAFITIAIRNSKGGGGYDDGDDGGYYRGGRYEKYGRKDRRDSGGWIITGGGSGGFGGGSGGFGGFGGGSFGGGGASGSW